MILNQPDETSRGVTLCPALPQGPEAFDSNEGMVFVHRMKIVLRAVRLALEILSVSVLRLQEWQ